MACQPLPDFGKDLCRKHQQSAGKNDRHDACIVHAQWHERRSTLVHFAAHSALRVLDWNLPLRLRDRNHPGDHRHQQRNQDNRNERIEAVFRGRAAEHVADALHRRRQARENADGDHQRHTIADASFRDLLPNHINNIARR